MQSIHKISILCLTLGLIGTSVLPSLARDFSVSGRRGSAVGARTFTRNSTGGFQRTGQWRGIGNRGGSRDINSTLNTNGQGGYQRDTSRTATGADGKSINTTVNKTGTYTPDSGITNSGTRTATGSNGGSVNSTTTLTTDGQGNYQRDVDRTVTGANGEVINSSIDKTGTYTPETGITNSGIRTVAGPNGGSTSTTSSLSTDGQGNYQRSTTTTGTGANGQVVNATGSRTGTYTVGEGVSSSGTHTINGTTVNTTFNDDILTITGPQGNSGSYNPPRLGD